jgi:hypothetical protein
MLSITVGGKTCYNVEPCFAAGYDKQNSAGGYAP